MSQEYHKKALKLQCSIEVDKFERGKNLDAAIRSNKVLKSCSFRSKISCSHPTFFVFFPVPNNRVNYYYGKKKKKI